MPRGSLDAVVESRLAKGGGGRYRDLCIDLMRCECEACGPGPEHLLEVGGRWDRVAKEYRGPAEQSRRFLLQDAQIPAARLFAAWLRERKERRHLLGPDGKPCFTLGLVGGRRGGKSDLVPKLALLYLLAFPKSIAWLVVPKFPDMPELEAALDGLLPRAWYTALGDPWYEWTLVNGSRLEIRSSYDPEDLKRGRCDIAVIHEAQKHDAAAYAMLRPAIADKGGLVLLAGNPPKTAKGEWLAELVERSRAGKTDEIVFNVDPRLNPHVDHAALESLKKIMDERTYAMEIRGDFLSRTDVVMFAFSPMSNVRPEGTDEQGRPLENVTRAFTQRMLGKSFDQVHGLDFQLGPYMAAATARFYRDPDEPNGDPLCWFVDDLEVPQATEEQLVSALEGRGYTGADACVPDASGEYQGAERIKGRASWDQFRMKGWRSLYFPDANSRANPHKTDRLANGNALLRNAAGKRRCFVDPKCAYLIRALRLWETRNGVPHWKSDYAHIVDAATYLLYRMYPRRAPAPTGRAQLITVPTKVGGLDGLR